MLKFFSRDNIVRDSEVFDGTTKYNNLEFYTNNDTNIFSPPPSSAPPQQIVSPITNVYWTSTEARKLFNAREGESTMEAVSTQISILKN